MKITRIAAIGLISATIAVGGFAGCGGSDSSSSAPADTAAAAADTTAAASDAVALKEWSEEGKSTYLSACSDAVESGAKTLESAGISAEKLAAYRSGFDELCAKSFECIAAKVSEEDGNNGVPEAATAIETCKGELQTAVTALQEEIQAAA